MASWGLATADAIRSHVAIHRRHRRLIRLVRAGTVLIVIRAPAAYPHIALEAGH